MSDKGKMVALADIHGCYRTLEALLKKLDSFRYGKFIFLGDYIDRGPDSKSVLELLIDFREDHDTIRLRGNHEQMMLDAVNKGDISLWMLNGGSQTLKSYGLEAGNLDIPPRHFDFINEMEVYYETDEYFFVHAGLPPDLRISDATKNNEMKYEFLWERSHLDLELDKPVWEKKVVFGHTPLHMPILTEKMIGIDTGCVFPHLTGMGYLTAAVLPDEQFIYQKNIELP